MTEETQIKAQIQTYRLCSYSPAVGRIQPVTGRRHAIPVMPKLPAILYFLASVALSSGVLQSSCLGVLSHSFYMVGCWFSKTNRSDWLDLCTICSPFKHWACVQESQANTFFKCIGQLQRCRNKCQITRISASVLYSKELWASFMSKGKDFFRSISS